MITETSNRPSHKAYVVHGEGEHSSWTEIGAAWANDDGQGYSIVLDALPNGGRLVLRTPKPKE